MASEKRRRLYFSLTTTQWNLHTRQLPKCRSQILLPLASDTETMAVIIYSKCATRIFDIFLGKANIIKEAGSGETETSDLQCHRRMPVCVRCGAVLC
jgi:hypothetical protein